MTTPAVPDLDTLRALYPVASVGLSESEMARASNAAFQWYCYLPEPPLMIEAINEMHAQASRVIDTPVKRAAFALLLAMIDDE